MRYVVIAPLLALSACATTDDETLARAQAWADRDVVCQSEGECEEMWGRAISWVAEFSSYRIQLQTDDLIQTYGPTPNSPYPAYMVSRTPLGDNQYRINFRAGCDNMFGCNPNIVIAHGAFNRTVLNEF